MDIYDDTRRKLCGIVLPIPMIYRNDLSVDHDAIEKYMQWCLDAGITTTCLTYGFSQIGFLTHAELMDVTRTIARTVGDRAIFIGCTTGNSPAETVATTLEMQKLGVDALFVMPHIQSIRSDYRDFLCHVAGKTDLPLLFANDPDVYDRTRASIGEDDLRVLADHKNIVGMKDEMRSIAYRIDLNRNFGDRFGVIGPGFRHFLAFFPHQAELDGYFSPRGSLQFLKLIEQNRLSDVRESLDQWMCAMRDRTPDLDGTSANQVCVHALGFGDGWQVRPPVVPATLEQAQDTIARIRKYPDHYQLPAS